MDYGNLKNFQTTNMAVFCPVFVQILSGFCVVFVGFSLFWQFVTTKVANLEKYGLWKSEKLPDCQYGGFLHILCGFWCIFVCF